MGMDAGVCGVYGLICSDFSELSPVCDKMLEEVSALVEEDEHFYSVEEIVASPIFQQKWLPKIRRAFAVEGIELPLNVALWWTGSEDERPARCETPADEFVIGYFLLSLPEEWESTYKISEWDVSFRIRARWHTWVWMG